MLRNDHENELFKVYFYSNILFISQQIIRINTNHTDVFINEFFKQTSVSYTLENEKLIST